MHELAYAILALFFIFAVIPAIGSGIGITGYRECLGAGAAIISAIILTLLVAFAIMWAAITVLFDV